MPDTYRAAGRADHLLELGRPGEALAVLRPALAASPQDPELLCRAGLAALRTNDTAQAEALARQAVAAAPGSEWPWRILSETLRLRGSLRGAAEAAYQAVRMQPDHYITHLQYGKCLGQLPEARTLAWAEANRAVELAPNEPGTHLLVADLAYPEGVVPSPQALDTAERALRRVLELDPEHSAARNDLGRVRLARRQPMQALDDFTGAVIANPRQHVAVANVRVVFLHLLTRAHWATVGVVWGTFLLSGGPDQPAPHWWVLPGVAACWGWWAWTLVRLRRVTRRRLVAFMRRFAQEDRLGALWVLSLAVAAIALAPSVAWFGALGVSWTAVCAAVGLSVVRAWWLRRKAH